MKVLKFGGSSVASAENIKKVVDIVRQIEGEAIAVLSAMQGTTDKLIDAGRMAERGDEGYAARLDEIRALHLKTINELVGSEHAIEKEVANSLDELDNLCRGVSLIGELSLRTLD